MALTLNKLFRLRFIFDMRGFWVDERIDGNLWPSGGQMYRVAKWFERRFLLNADHVVSLTSSAVQIMERFDYLQGRMPPVTVIPTCADLNRFKPVSYELTPPPFVLGYVGTVGTWYMFDEVVASLVILLQMRPEARLLVVSRDDHDHIRQRLQSAGVPESATEIRSASHAEVPALMARMHAGIFFIKPAFSKQASAPTKLAEFLGCGIPCLGNAGVGDMAAVLEGERVGVVINAFDEASLKQGLKQLLILCTDPEVTGRCVAAAHRHYSLEEGVARYQAIYESLEKSIECR
jgi:glycosyltransferase involved in cell wall biosynthesis